MDIGVEENDPIYVPEEVPQTEELPAPVEAPPVEAPVPA